MIGIEWPEDVLQNQASSDYLYDENYNICFKTFPVCNSNTADYTARLQQKLTAQNATQSVLKVKTICGVSITYLKQLYMHNKDSALNVWKNSVNGYLFYNLVYNGEHTKHYLGPMFNFPDGSVADEIKLVAMSQDHLKDPSINEKKDFRNFLKNINYKEYFTKSSGSVMGNILKKFVFFVGPFNKKGKDCCLTDLTKYHHDNYDSNFSTLSNGDKLKFHKEDLTHNLLKLGTYVDDVLVYPGNTAPTPEYFNIIDTKDNNGTDMTADSILKLGCSDTVSDMFVEATDHTTMKPHHYLCELYDLIMVYIEDHIEPNPLNLKEYDMDTDMESAHPVMQLKIALKSVDVDQKNQAVHGNLFLHLRITNHDMVKAECIYKSTLNEKNLCKQGYQTKITLKYNFEVLAERNAEKLFPSLTYAPDPSTLFELKMHDIKKIFYIAHFQLN